MFQQKGESNMNERDLNRIQSEHWKASRHIDKPPCPVCGEIMINTTIDREVDLLDMWGGVCWATVKSVPVWQCINGHIIHMVILEGV
jgi:hypothetical protein